MQISRNWATPLTIGAFILSATTGVLMFFHLDTGLNVQAHEWLGWALVTGVACHVTVNFSSFRRYWNQPRSLAIIGLFVALLVTSFFIKGEEEDHPAQRVMQAALNAPLKDLAPLAHQTPDALIATLQAAGFKVESPEQSLQSVTGADRERQADALRAVFH